MNEQNTTPDSQKSQGQRAKTKVALNTEELKVLLNGWIEAIYQKKDFNFTINGQAGRVPQAVLLKNTTMGEFEFKNGEYEFELELKWKEGSEKIQ